MGGISPIQCLSCKQLHIRCKSHPIGRLWLFKSDAHFHLAYELSWRLTLTKAFNETTRSLYCVPHFSLWSQDPASHPEQGGGRSVCVCSVPLCSQDRLHRAIIIHPQWSCQMTSGHSAYKTFSPTASWCEYARLLSIHLKVEPLSSLLPGSPRLTRSTSTGACMTMTALQLKCTVVCSNVVQGWE